VLTGPIGSFTTLTSVDSVEDVLNNISFVTKGIVNAANSTIMRIRLKAKPPKPKDTITPDTGTLTITLSNGPPVDPVPVAYVNDDDVTP